MICSSFRTLPSSDPSLSSDAALHTCSPPSPGDAVRREHAQADALDTGAAKALAQRIEKPGRDATAAIGRKHLDVRDETEPV